MRYQKLFHYVTNVESTASGQISKLQKVIMSQNQKTMMIKLYIQIHFFLFKHKNFSGFALNGLQKLMIVSEWG